MCFDSYSNQCLRYSSTGCLQNIAKHYTLNIPSFCTSTRLKYRIDASKILQSSCTIYWACICFRTHVRRNPLAEFVELPEEALEGGLWYGNVLCGVLRGALEMVSLLS